MFRKKKSFIIFLNIENHFTFCFVKNKIHLHVFTVLEAEAIDLLEAIKEAISTGMQVVGFETDCKTIHDALSVNNIPQNELGDLISQCKSLLLNRPDFVVSYV